MSTGLDDNRATAFEGTCLGHIVGVDGRGSPLVDFPSNPFGPLPARSTVTLLGEMLNVEREVLLAFAENDPQQPIIVGLIQEQPLLPTPPIGKHEPRSPLEVSTDGRMFTVTAYSELRFRCGESSITLRRDGKIVIQGVSILSRAKVCNRIKGGSVQIN
jgi:Domain of unknown function (DUF6484)